MSDLAQDFVRSCLVNRPQDRPTIAQLLRHPWIRSYQASCAFDPG
jgi:serine/threonine protein kinase